MERERTRTEGETEGLCEQERDTFYHLFFLLFSLAIYDACFHLLHGNFVFEIKRG